MRTLLAVCGLTPQIVTETLYALQQQGRMPHRIRVLTTREGKDRCIAQLLDPEDGAYYRFLRDYGQDHKEIDFSPRHVHAVSNSQQRQVDDITDEEDNALFLRACMEEAFRLTRDPEATVYFSIAGGRKTMGACLAAAAQFYARPWDRVFHVLVSPPEFESSREFFFPPAEPEYVLLRNSEGNELYMRTDQARITLVSMPFVSLRDRLEDSMLQSPEEPSSLLMSLVREQEGRLVINLEERKVVWKGVEADMAPARLALYAFFALRKKEAECGMEDCRGCRDCAIGYDDLRQQDLERIARIHDSVADRHREDTLHSGIRSLERETLSQYRSKINHDLFRAFGPYEADVLKLESLGERNERRYHLSVDRSRIRVVL